MIFPPHFHSPFAVFTKIVGAILNKEVLNLIEANCTKLNRKSQEFFVLMKELWFAGRGLMDIVTVVEKVGRVVMETNAGRFIRHL